MRARAAIALSTALLAVAAACAHGGGAGAGAPPDGELLYRRHCGSCHRLKAPSEHDAETWRRAVGRFGARLAPAEREAVAAWLAARARP